MQAEIGHKMQDSASLYYIGMRWRFRREIVSLAALACGAVPLHAVNVYVHARLLCKTDYHDSEARYGRLATL
jgi:hypothetical protein